MESRQRRIEIYQTAKRQQPFQEWIDGLKDREGRTKITARIDRLSLGNFAGCKSLGGGLHELKVDFGPGYRVYFADVDNVIVLLLCGGDKGTQAKDIDVAKKYLADYKREPMKIKPSVDYHEYLVERLRDPAEALAYLKAALEERDLPEVFLLALRNVAEARGFRKLAQDTKLNRENLYRMLSKKGNPSLASLHSLLDSLGFRLSVEKKSSRPQKPLRRAQRRQVETGNR